MVGSRETSFSLHRSGSISNLGLTGGDLFASSHTYQYKHYYTLENPLPLGTLGWNAFKHPWTYQVSYIFPAPALVPIVKSMFLKEHVTGYLRFLLLVAPYGGSLASNSS